ncbi:hypothetical protein [Nostoc sp.]|uniref:hypothetical protein n=1 Tax=Nostoc sp. TaxID=1180 RepID=UPI003593E846
MAIAAAKILDMMHIQKICDKLDTSQSLNGNERSLTKPPLPITDNQFLICDRPLKP